jgi:hypothetical protein
MNPTRSEFERGVEHGVRSVRSMHDRDLAARDDALVTLRTLIGDLEGFQRAENSEFWISRDDVLRLVDEVFPRA